MIRLCILMQKGRLTEIYRVVVIWLGFVADSVMMMTKETKGEGVGPLCMQKSKLVVWRRGKLLQLSREPKCPSLSLACRDPPNLLHHRHLSDHFHRLYLYSHIPVLVNSCYPLGPVTITQRVFRIR